MRIATLRHRREARKCLAFAGPDGAFIAVPDALAAMSGTRDAVPMNTLMVPEANGWLEAGGLGMLAALRDAALGRGVAPADMADWRLDVPVTNPGKIIAVGRNYMDHVREGQELWAKRGKVVTIPEFPSAFAKFPSSLTGPDTAILVPQGVDDVDYEIELAVVIGTKALNVTEDEALKHVAGYTICNDIGARGIQRKEMEAQIGITLAKNFPTFAPMGPWLVTADEIPDPQALEIGMKVEGESRQHANTSDMIFSVAYLVSYWSRVGLDPGDIIITGTPSGVALARAEPEKFYLRAGQTVTAWIDGIGELNNTIADGPR
ncbi:MAG TPA: fumarylacetoacetate hydrolase family protein [Aliidongia sp.]|uniref:fumarylacetoacetate hydrolase family protein n=1 Tax=Aliidongia sp. TaxID=1914230 RepID=UPI002DDDABC5|nr:fumarylacetoacetate hydrolase family protein [Aliidongia sp.]HEV2673781.1 fumarylacetoacetate hydrolase family protein [Aliidongia sp.]